MFLHTFYPQPVIFNFGWLTLYWYGLIVVLATLTGLWLVIKLNQKYSSYRITIFKNKDQIFDLYFYLVIFGIIGARVYEVLLFPSLYLANPLAILQIWHGGLAIHGAIIGGGLALWWYVKKQQLSLALVADLVAPAVAVGQAIGRWGNYFNQELFGLPTKMPWGIPIDFINRPAQYENYLYFHPTFLYESLLSLVLVGFLLFLHFKKYQQIQSRQPEFKAGQIALCYLIGYSLIRFILEFIKIDETPLLLGVRWPQIISVLIASTSFYVFKKRI